MNKDVSRFIRSRFQITIGYRSYCTSPYLDAVTFFHLLYLHSFYVSPIAHQAGFTFFYSSPIAHQAL